MGEGGILGVVQVPQDHHGGVLGPAEGVELHARGATHRNKKIMKTDALSLPALSTSYHLAHRDTSQANPPPQHEPILKHAAQPRLWRSQDLSDEHKQRFAV